MEKERKWSIYENLYLADKIYWQCLQTHIISALGLFPLGIFSSDQDNEIEGLFIKFSEAYFVRDI